MQYNKPLKNSTNFNVQDFNFQDKNVSYKTLEQKILVNPIDESQSILINNLVSSSNALSLQVNENTTLQSTVTDSAERITLLENVPPAPPAPDYSTDISLLQTGQSIQASSINNLENAAQEMSFVDTNGGQTKFNNVKVSKNLTVVQTLNDISIDFFNPSSSIQAQFNALFSQRRVRAYARVTSTPLVTLESNNCNIIKDSWGGYSIHFTDDFPVSKHYHVQITGSHNSAGALTQFQIVQDLSFSLTKVLFYVRDENFQKIDLSTGSFNISVTW